MGDASVSTVTVTGGTVGNAERVIAGMRAGVRACYNRALAMQPDLQVTLRIAARVGPNGEVREVDVKPSDAAEFPEPMRACIRSRIMSAQFDAPGGGGATLMYTIVLTPRRE